MSESWRFEEKTDKEGQFIESNTFGVVFYDDAKGPGAVFAMDAAMAEVPEQACLADHQKVSFWFRFAEKRPYGDVKNLWDKVAERLESAGWTVASAVEGYPDTGPSIDYLDTVFEFPEMLQAHGYNAAGGFCVIVEKLATKPEFSGAEFIELYTLAKELSQLVYGKELEEVV